MNPRCAPVAKASPLAQGFTLLELLLVIVILGTLASIALPRLLDLGHDARLAKMQGALASVQSAYNLAISKWATSGGGPGFTLHDGSHINFVDVSASNQTCGTNPSGCGCVPDTDSLPRMVSLHGGVRAPNAGYTFYGGNGSVSTSDGWISGASHNGGHIGFSYFADYSGQTNGGNVLIQTASNVTCGFTYTPPTSCSATTSPFTTNFSAC